MAGGKPRVAVGLINAVDEIPDQVALAFSLRCDYTVTPLGQYKDGFTPFVELSLEPRIWSSAIVGLHVSDMQAELSWALHMGIYSFMISINGGDWLEKSIEFQRAFLPSHTEIWIRASDWGAWNSFRSSLSEPEMTQMCYVVLVLDDATSFIDGRWSAEPVVAVEVTAQALQLHGQFIQQLCLGGAHLITNEFGVEAVKRFISFLPEVSRDDQWVSGYQDFLQIPLQPLKDNLPNSTYAVFEHDRTKYDLYEEAITRELSKHQRDEPVRIAVGGAGRGGLVDASLRAASRAGCRVVVTAIEKNPHAVATLRAKCSQPSWEAVTVVQGSLKDVELPRLVDIMVTELLGSFGDNEASPECVNDAMRLLDTVNGVSIPRSYTSSTEPISSHKLWNKISLDSVKLQTLYVVSLRQVYFPSTAQFVFEFNHSRSLVDLEKRARLHFVNQGVDTVIHGFACYFHCDLGNGVTMSTHPATKTPGMLSWFPGFLPLIDPVPLPAGAGLTLEISRCVRPCKALWYEWMVVEPVVGKLHNLNGKAYSVSLD